MRNSQCLATLFSYSFRVFFLLAAAYGAIAILAWVAMVLQWPLPLPLAISSLWHVHEMLFGFVAAAIAGFLLTAMSNWTGAPPLSGSRLALLVVLWLAGRVAMWLSAVMPYALVAAIDGAFLPVLAMYVAAVLARYGNRRNYVLVAVLAGLSLANALMHAAVIQADPSLATRGIELGLDLTTLLMAVVAGRITPAFSGNWLRARGEALIEPFWPWLTSLALASIAVLAVAGLLGLGALPLGCVALLAAAANALRLISWRGWRVRREPLLWILHLAYGFIALALFARALYLFGFMSGPSFWHHAIGVGAIGLLIAGVITRVSMGHTGRPLVLLPAAAIIYYSLIGAAVLRLAVSLGLVGYAWGIALAAAGWVLGYGMFVSLYGPLLLRPRPDGRPG